MPGCRGSQIGLFFVVTFLVLAAYGACLNIPLAHHDSLRYFAPYFRLPDNPMPRDPFYEYTWAMGRPVAAETENWIYLYAKGFAGLSAVRAVCALLAGLAAFLMTLSLRRIGLGPAPSVLLGVFLAVLPGMQNGVYMLMPYYIVGVAAAAGAYLCWTSLGPVRPKGLLTGLLLFLSLLCYQVAAFAFLALLTAGLLWAGEDRREKVFREVFGGGLLLAAASALYLGFAKLVLLPRFPAMVADTPGAHQFSFSLEQVLYKMSYFFTDSALFICNPFSPAGGTGAGYAVIFIILFALTLDRSWTWSWRWKRMSLWCLLLLGSVAVWTISPLEVFLYRALYPGMALCAVSLVWALSTGLRAAGGPKVLTEAGLALVLGLGIIGAQHRLAVNVWNHNAEMTFLRSRLSAAARADVRRIHVVEPRLTGYGFNGLRALDDVFNMNSSNFWFDIRDLVKMGLWGQVPERPLLDCGYVQDRCVGTAPAGVLVLTQSKPGAAIVPSDNMLIVDLGDMARAAEVFRR